MRPRNTIIALALLLVVGGYAWIQYRYMAEVPATKLYTIKPEDIARIHLRYPGNEIELDREDNGAWRIAKPVSVDADQTAANNLARAIADCEVQKTVDEKPEALAPFGLDNPLVIVTVTTKDGKTLPGIALGKMTPVGFSVYMKTTAKPAVMLASSAFQAGMNKTLDQLRNRDLTDFKIDDVKRFTIEHDSGDTIEIARDGDKWKIVKPGEFPADPLAVRQYLTTLVNAKVTDFITDTPPSVSQYGLDKPHVAATAYTGKSGEEHQSLLIGFKESGEGKSGYYARRGERVPVYTVQSWLVSALDKRLLDMRDKMVMTFDPAAVATIKVDRQSRGYTLTRDAAGNWTVDENGKPSQASASFVQRYIENLRDLRGMSILADPMPSPTLFAMDKPELTITLLDKDGKQIGWYKLSQVKVDNPGPAIPGEPAGPPTEMFATSSANEAVYSLNDFHYQRADRAARHFKVSNPRLPAAAASPSPAAQP
jgi:hypothetical protein